VRTPRIDDAWDARVRLEQLDGEPTLSEAWQRHEDLVELCTRLVDLLDEADLKIEDLISDLKDAST